ncbi:class I SAM-dependent methyltransferase [Pseudarthrobacter phenanthrenivorans]|uniref:Class I SAM-dependent methyltransferase n=1 Tax=Pseudarthrobacter phenanthrenivorans TaxID=361575 RepID=A0A3B0FU47_PSEPS|nr:class I SAM-dependent methyltransferase [Pseudarthrobacter phenanthrenivorans]RKO23400.1 class I SAM-dependent methyltransferase [Pseudarthrobacter phenanthrenivorans]TPV51196.1 class I SAM-dependent methyltransferase [Pseudarthrobacter phenanthrenivorans]
MVPKLLRLSRSAPKERPVAWDTYWAGIREAGAGSEILWDAGTDREFLGYKEVLLRHLDPELPVVDVGCGHGSFTRALAGVFGEVIGVDVSGHAVAHAAAHPIAEDRPLGQDHTLVQNRPGTVRYEARDMTAPGAAEGLTGTADANVFIRGVLHVLDPSDQAALVENLRLLAGSRGTLFLAETNFQGNPVEYVSHLGATHQNIPAPLERAIRGLPMPGHFGPEERLRALPPESWELLEDGEAAIETNPLTGVAGNSRVPGYFAVLRPRN